MIDNLATASVVKNNNSQECSEKPTSYARHLPETEDAMSESETEEPPCQSLFLQVAFLARKISEKLALLKQLFARRSVKTSK